MRFLLFYNFELFTQSSIKYLLTLQVCPPRARRLAQVSELWIM